MKKFVVMDQVMPIVLDGKTHYLVLKEMSSKEEAVEWIRSQSMNDRDYVIREVNAPFV